MLDSLCNQIIDKLKKLSPLVSETGTDRWEEYCYNLQGGYDDQQLWEDYIIAQVSIVLDDLKQVEKLEVWLDTNPGNDFFNEIDEIISLETLAKNRHAKDIPYCEDDIIDEVYKLVKEVALDAELDG